MSKPPGVYPVKPARVPDTSLARLQSIRLHWEAEDRRTYYTEPHERVQDLLAMLDDAQATIKSLVIRIGEMSLERNRTMPRLDLNTMFTYHAPKPGQPEQYQRLRDKAKELAQMILDECPETAEQTLAIRHVEQAIFYANAAIARYGKAEEVPQS